MKVTRGLIIADPWIGHILEGQKDWEMRAQATSHRGWFGLIRKGSGQVVGLARLTECGLPLTPDEMIASHEHHRIPETMIRSGTVSKWIIPWKLADIRLLEQPVSYEHKSGAVTWVLFSAEVSIQLAKLLASTVPLSRNDETRPTRTINVGVVSPITKRSTIEEPEKRPVPKASEQPLTETPRRLLGRSQITGGNLRNNHFYVREFLDKFPADAIGGSNKKTAASRDITVDWGGPSLVLTDIDRTKGLFRKRSWVRQFFSASGAREGDTVVVTSSDPYHVHVRVERRSAPTLSEP
ncbi:hypothetical protein DYI23_03790 [Roseibium polysiphoniae]|uniref:ASCH domain-containing protein n=1 Tax=Roseibium polysiphoniae TaxID=2571221 RepID=A0A944C902_9HYPH|nr:hypothetical protein [Roseibium polysiphoniae]MBS8259335.1 hypothetical protein [Roseibium polysiphoniae]